MITPEAWTPVIINIINYAYICSWIHVHNKQHVFWNEKTKHTCELKKSIPNEGFDAYYLGPVYMQWGTPV